MPKNSTTKKSTEQYKKLYKELKPYITEKIDLRKPLTTAHKSFITRYSNELHRMTKDKPYAVQIFRSSNKSRLKAAQELGGQNSKLKSFKVAFVPKTSEHQKIRFNKKGEPRIVTAHVTANYIKLDAEELAQAEDVKEYIDDLLKNKTYKTYGIQAGDYEISYTAQKPFIGREVARLCAQYSNAQENNYFGNWLGGLFGYEFTNQGDLNNYREAKRTAQLKKDRASRKRNKNVRAKLFYWYDRKKQIVLLSKTHVPPNKNCEEITFNEYQKFLKYGEI